MQSTPIVAVRLPSWKATPASSPRMPRVVIVCAGFSGLAAATALKHAAVQVTIIDRRNYHLFQPLLYQVATAALSPADIAQPIRNILRRQRNATVLLGRVTGIDTAAPMPVDYRIQTPTAFHRVRRSL
jgi:NADH:ubiquinone reductase (H+-translocating)